MDAWYQSHGGSSIDVPLGTVAALALLRQPPDTGTGLADWILGRQPHELPSSSRRSTSATGSNAPT